MREHREEQLLILARAMANVAASDGRVDEQERDQLDRVLRVVGISPGEPRVSKVIEAEFKSPGSLTEIVSGLKEKDLRVALLRMMVEISCADGVIADAERAKVKEAAKAFGFDPELASELMTITLETIKLEARETELMSKLLQ